MLKLLKNIFGKKEVETIGQETTFLKSRITNNDVIMKASKRQLSLTEEKYFFDMIGNNYESMHIYLNTFSKQMDLLQKMNHKLGANISSEYLSELFIDIYIELKDCKSMIAIDKRLDKYKIKEIFERHFGELFKGSRYNKQTYNNFVEKFCIESSFEIINSAYMGDIIMSKMERLDGCLDILKDTDFQDKDSFFLSQAYILINTIGCIVAFLKSIILIDYFHKITEESEFLTILNDKSSSLSDLYKIYKEFYIDVFPEQLKTYQFEGLIRIKDNYDEDFILKVKEIFSIIELDIDEFLNQCNNQNIYSDYEKINSLKGFEKLLHNNAVEIIFIDSLPYFLLNKNSIGKWLINLFEQNKFIDKINIQIKKNEILRKSQIPKIQEIKDKYNKINTGEEFEVFLKQVYEQLGFKVSLTAKTGDQGADLIIEKNEVKSVIQAKFYSSTVGNSAVQEVIGAIGFYKANKGMVITNNTFTKSAKELANANNIQLIDGTTLVSIIETVI